MYTRGLRLLLVLAGIIFLARSSGLLADSRTKLPIAPGANALHPVSPSALKATPVAPEDEHFTKARRSMVENLRRYGIKDERVLAAMGKVQRQRFVPADRQEQAYSDDALQIGHGQTISSPHIVALMTELVRPSPEKRVLDIGTGSGYQAAVLAKLCKQVYSIEIVEPLAIRAAKRLTALGYANVTVRCGDGYHGWREAAAVRHHCCGRGARPRSAGAHRSTRPRRPARDPRGRWLARVALDRKGHTWLDPTSGGLAGEVRSHDRPGPEGAENPLVMGRRYGKPLAPTANIFSQMHAIGNDCRVPGSRTRLCNLLRTLDFGSGWTAVSLVGTIIAMAKDQTRKARAAGVVSVGRNGRCARAVDGWVQAMD